MKGPKRLLLLNAIIIFGCSPTFDRILLKSVEADNNYCDVFSLLPSMPDFPFAETTEDQSVLSGINGWLYFYGIGEERLEKFLENLPATVIKAVDLCKTANGYEIVVHTQGNIPSTMHTSNGWFALSVQLIGDKNPFIKGARKDEMVLLYSTANMDSCLLLIGNPGSVYFGKNRSPVWKHHLRLMAKLPLKIHKRSATFFLPNNLLAEDASLKDAWVRTHAIAKPGRPLSCSIPELLLLPTVDELYTFKGGVFYGFSVPWIGIVRQSAIIIRRKK